MSDTPSIPSGTEAEEPEPEEESLLMGVVRRPDLFGFVARHLGHRDYVCRAVRARV